MISKNRIKFIRSLQQKKFRDESGQFLIEGEKNVKEALTWKNDSILAVYHTTSFRLDFPVSDQIEIEEVTEQELKQLSSLNTPNKVVALCKKWDQPIASHLDFVLALDGVQDPGNLGTLIRLADWFGVKQLLCSPNTVDCFNPKVIQATMGSLFRVSIAYTDLKSYFSTAKLPVYGALLNGENVYGLSLKAKGILLLGNEGNGISDELIPLITNPITIPRFGEAESLNVSVAGGILLSEFFRMA